MDQLIVFLLSQHKIPFDKEELSFQIQSHPSYPSLHAITGVLDHFNIDNLALDVPVNENTLSQLPKVFLAQLETDQGKQFAVVINKGLNYQVIFSKKEKKQWSLNKFLKQFTGIIVAIEKPEQPSIDLKQTNSKTVTTTLGVIAIALLISIIATFSNSKIATAHFILSLVGVYISSAIFKQEQGQQSFLGDTFCSSNNAKTNCSSVLSSKGARIGNYKLSDFSIIYFSGLSITALFLNLSQTNTHLLYVISLLAVPITIYSIYYQYAVIKSWCLLCLSIVGVLWLQATSILLTTNGFTFNIAMLTWPNVSLFVFAFLTVFTLWTFLSPRLKQFKELKASKVKYFKFKRDFTLFQTLLNTSEKLNTTIKDTTEIVFGNKNAALEIVLVTSPFCGHCKPVHTLIEQILNKHADHVKIIIRFSVHEANTPLIEITSRLLELYDTNGPKQCLEAMHDIYGDMDNSTWIGKWKNASDQSKYLEILKSESEWCNNNTINFTPAILINGKQYPKEYERPELLFFIEDLYEHANDSILNSSVLQNAL